MSGLSHGLSLATGAALGIALLVALVACWRREQGRRRWGLMVLNVAAIGATAAVLMPPVLGPRADVLIVLNDKEDRGGFASPFAARRVALPGAAAPRDVQRVPDLATALRLHPEVRRIDVIGDGLRLRDLEAASRVDVHFVPKTESGLIDLALPERTYVGRQWPLKGKAAAAQVELRDPSGALVDQAPVDASGAFVLSAVAKAAGLAVFELRTLSAEQTVIDTTTIPIAAQSGVPQRVLLRAGAPSAELKYWRRWAVDAGIELQSIIGLTDGLSLRDGPNALPNFADQDLAVLDERSWQSLSDDEKSALLAAVDQGLGLLLRVSGPLDATVLQEWSALGFVLQPSENIRGISLDRTLAQQKRSPFTAAAFKIGGDGLIPLITDDTGQIIAAARSYGAGRIAVWGLLDSFRLLLEGESGRYGQLWAQAFEPLARPRALNDAPAMEAPAWVGERSTLCDLAAGAAVRSQTGAVTRLLVARRCAGFWPQQPGWYGVQRADGQSAPLYVRAEDDGSGLRRHRDRANTLALAAREPAIEGALESTPRTSLPRWPFALLWLLSVGLLWGFERRHLTPT